MESPELSKLRKICGYGHIFLILVTIFCTLLLALSIVAFCIFLVIDDPTIMDQDRHTMIITMRTAVIDFAAFTTISYLLDRMIKTMKNGESPFTNDNAHILVHMATISVVSAVASIVGQVVGIVVLNPENYPGSIPFVQIGGAIVLYSLALIFGYGAQLQKESDETL